MKPTRLIDIRTNVLKWSQQKLADELGYARNSVSRMELGKQPIERVAELAVYWLMYRECQIVCNGFPDDDLTPENTVELQHNVAINDMQHDVAKTMQSLQHDVASISGSQFITDLNYFLKYEAFSDLNAEMRDDFFKRFDKLIIQFLPLYFGPAEFSFLDSYMSLPCDVWFNERKGRAFFKEHYLKTA